MRRWRLRSSAVELRRTFMLSVAERRAAARPSCARRCGEARRSRGAAGAARSRRSDVNAADGGRHDGAALGRLSRRSGERRPADSRGRQRQRRERSRRDAAVERQPERQRGVVGRLLQAGANPNLALPAGETPLMVAVALGQGRDRRAAARQGRQRRTRGRRAARPRSCGPPRSDIRTSSRCCSRTAPTFTPAPRCGAR